jgi:hypothetical protein
MKEVCPKFRLRSHGNRVVWIGLLKPGSITDAYLVEIDYRQNERPVVRILAPSLEVSRSQFQEVHIFGDGSLCLHSDTDWNPTMPIAATVLLWVNEWLIYYELWKATGQWYGGGEYLVSTSDKKRGRRR